MRWRLPPALEERRIAGRRARRLRNALSLYGYNESDGLPTAAELERERDAALIELLRDFRLFYGTPGWSWLESAVTEAAVKESRRIVEAGAKQYYVPPKTAEPGDG